ncbi:HNH endonuclease signature motif containing protein [Mycobacterium sp. SMC-4]|uniref:HNH endonuclease signature motif containing protein n=1 Tax=Mycobacterium sp. SMC-4 TaxID=2857059 RepID=UPI0021B3D6A0|nr:HNH endonuclease signature motif containing protein [Mycobacterium sp. SMC-4]UXA19062.1 HNH endonuclease [Mycobacterium sp. SMC-4]
MFDSGLPGPAHLRGVTDRELIDAVAGWARTAAAAEARKLAAVAELARRRCSDPEHPDWACDDWDSAATEIACALTVGHGRALGQIDLALTLRNRLPKTGARFLAGEIPAALVSTIAWRTMLIVDDDALTAVDGEIAERAPMWGTLSKAKLEQAVDLWVEKYDPDAVRRTNFQQRSRSFTIGDREDRTGTVTIHGRVSATDAALARQRFAAMITGVCADDPRTMDQRRADAFGALSAGSTHLACRCGNSECPAAADDGRASSFVINVIAEQQSLDHEPGLDLDGTADTGTTVGGDTSAPRPAPVARRKAGLIPGMRNGLVPAPLLAQLIAFGAKVRFVTDADSIEGCAGHRPSTALERFVRNRDLTCRVPGCDRSAMSADIDHTQPWPDGPTHASNLKCYCRIHHLVKTFWDGWSDSQQPDGSVTITSPTGHTYTTAPLSSLLFPGWRTTTTPSPSRPPPDAPAQSAPPRDPRRGQMMPRRRRSRSDARRYRINAERRHNAARRQSDPPPF